MSGCNVLAPMILIPDLAVPYAAPIPVIAQYVVSRRGRWKYSQPKIMAAAMPACTCGCQYWDLITDLGTDELLTMPKKGANLGASSASNPDIMREDFLWLMVMIRGESRAKTIICMRLLHICMNDGNQMYRLTSCTLNYDSSLAAAWFCGVCIYADNGDVRCLLCHQVT